MAAAIQPVFLIALVCTVLAFAVTLFTPRGSVNDLASHPSASHVGMAGE